MFRSALEIAQVTQTSQASWATTWLNLGTSLRKLGKLNDAREAYVKVLEIDSRSAAALGFLGLVYHLMDRLDDAIVKYHEVRALSSAPLGNPLLSLPLSPTHLLLVSVARFQVGSLLTRRLLPVFSGIKLQALSVNPINAHVLELLNLALEASADAGPFARLGGAGRSDEWEGQMRAHAAPESQLRATWAKEKEKEAETSSRAMFGDMQEGEAGMALG